MAGSVITLPIGTGTGDPNEPTLEEAVERIEDEAVEVSPEEKLARLLSSVGQNLAENLPEGMLSEIGNDVVADYTQDDKDREEWKKTAIESLDAASQSKVPTQKDFPWRGASNINFPILTEACLQFNARMYPAVVKGDEAVLCKVIGQDNGKAKRAPNPSTGEIMDMPKLQPGPDGQPVPVQGPDGMMEPDWEVPPGAKAKRARRVSEYLNTTLFYRLEDWESDTDSMMMQLPAVGTSFRKISWDGVPNQPRVEMVPALRLIVPKGAKSCKTAERTTEEIPDVAYREILGKMHTGFYRAADLGVAAEDLVRNTRMLLEQHRYIDLDEDGVPEPYIVTVDCDSQEVLRIEANFTEKDIVWAKEEALPIEEEMPLPMFEGDMAPAMRPPARKVAMINKGQFYVKYGLFPDPKGGFYDLGLGHLLKQVMGIIDSSINQLIDAGTAQIAGGGFIGSGVRLQGGKSGVLSIQPGEYKTVPVAGAALREAIVEKTLPNVSPVTFQVLEMIMGAAQSIAGAKDVITGEASNNGQVGTTLALIEQGLQVFNATAKRIFRSLKEEFTLLRDKIVAHGGDQAAEDYMNILDDPEADFMKDLAAQDFDIRPVSDPSSVTRMQKLAKAQFVMGTIPILATVGGDPREALRRTYEAVDAEDIDKLLPPPAPPQPDPIAMAKAEETAAKVRNLDAKTINEKAKTAQIGVDAQNTEMETVQKGLEAHKTKYEMERDAILDGAQIAFGALGMGQGRQG